MAFIKKLFAPPIFEDEEKTHQAYLLHTILLALIIIPIPFVIYILIQMPEESDKALLSVVVSEIINIFPFIMLRRGYVRSASIIQIATLWLFFAFISVNGAGVYGIAYLLGNGLVITISGILLGGRGAVAMTVLAMVEGGVMVYAESNGWMPPDILDDALPTWIVAVVLFAVGAILQNLASRTLRTALIRAKESEEKYRLISRVSSDYVFVTEVYKDGRSDLSWVAGAFEQMTGYSFEEYVASGGWVGHVHPDDLEKDAQDMETLHKNKDIKSEVRTFAKNGEIRWERIFAHPIWDEKENRLVRIIGAVQDVTEQKQTEANLKEILLQQSAILNGIPDMAWLKDIEGQYIAVNEQFIKTAGIKTGQIAGKTDFDIWQKSFAEKYRDDDLEVMKTRQRKNTEELQIDGTGREYWVETTKTPIFNTVGEVVGTTGIAREITERKKNEELEQRRRIMLEKVIELGKQVTETSDLRTTVKKIWHGVHDDLKFDRLAIFLYNPERNSMDDTFGTNNQGQMIDVWDLWFPVTEGISEAVTFMSVLEKPDGLYFTDDYSITHHIPEGHDMYGVREFAAVAVWAGNKPIAVICVDNFITMRPIASEQLEALRLFAGYAGLAIENAYLNETIQKELSQKRDFIEELESKNAELERFTYTVSHDLKSPLVTIKGFLGYLERDAQENNFEKFRHDVERIEAAVAKMQNLLKDLLELSRVGRLMNAPVEVTFHEIVKDALEIVHGQIQAKNILIEFHNNKAILKCDRIRMVEVLQNLIDNAIKFMGSQPRPRIEIGEFFNDKKETVFYVKDNGIGIAPEFQDKIFGLFDKLNIDSDGTGIGLALVKRIIEVHGGRIWVESQVGSGTTFYFTLS
ncbi:MAG: PAS domain S-box protein [Anaerolineales bacterium]|nr:PAS domain S-box protein [Anaerolineales bacterium]